MQSVIPRTIGDSRDGGPAASAGPAVAGPARSRDAARALRAAAAAAGLAVIGGYLAIALARVGYPGHLEILEDNSLIEMRRILAGQQVYTAPSASYVPDGYPPLYFALSAAAASVLGQSYLPLRLVSVAASLACFAVLGRLVQRETGSGSAGVAAAGLFASTYFAVGTWFDVGRVDSLFLALSVAGLYAARWARRTGGAIAAGVLLGAAFCTKQSALAEGILVLAVLAVGPRRRLAGAAAAAYAAVIGASTIALGLTSHGWYVYYVFQEMSQHALSAANVRQFWAPELLPTFAVAVCAALLLLATSRPSPALLVGCGALAVESFAARAQGGSNLNDVLPAYLAVALLAGLAMGGRHAPLAADGGDALSRAPGRLSTRSGWAPRVSRWRGGRTRRWVPVAASALVVVQIAVLAVGFRLSAAFPSQPDRAAEQRLTATARALGGTVAIPADPGVAVLAGLPPTEDQVAAADVLHASDRSATAMFTASLARAVSGQQFSAIITEFHRDLRGYPSDLPLYYYQCPQALADGAVSIPFSANAGAVPVSVWLPIGRGRSCAAVERLLEP